MTPIDVVKTRIQVDPALARHSLLSGGRLIVAREGPKGLLTGFGPTAVGYLAQVRAVSKYPSVLRAEFNRQ